VASPPKNSALASSVLTGRADALAGLVGVGAGDLVQGERLVRGDDEAASAAGHQQRRGNERGVTDTRPALP
jgi:hypothetical protein